MPTKILCKLKNTILQDFTDNTCKTIRNVVKMLPKVAENSENDNELIDWLTFKECKQ